jgi:hypothetical protein
VLYEQSFIDNLKDRANQRHAMNRFIVWVATLLLGSLAVASSAQESPKAILTDEYETLTCEMTISTIDSFFSELSRHSGATGLVVLTSPPEQKHRAAFRQAIIEYQTKWRQFDGARFRFLRAKSNGEPKVQFWLIPSGAQPPDVPNVDMSYALPRSLKPFLLGLATKFGSVACPNVNEAKIFAMFLKGNPSARGNIVVRDKSLGQARTKARIFVSRFQQRYGIRANRLRTFPARLIQPSNVDEAIVEYWYLS